MTHVAAMRWPGQVTVAMVVVAMVVVVVVVVVVVMVVESMARLASAERSK